uniref:BAR/IMD domain containing adaptor protein 2 n=1 Tax=Sphaeramia orbicularis TaxID=375764 RepID=A0A673BIZ1_9TELE
MFAGVTYAAKGYFDALVRMGEMLKSFHNELLTELEKKVELDARYLNAALKKYQMEHKSKGESLEKCQAELKKLRRKSQGSKHPSKYGDKEMQVSVKTRGAGHYIAEGYKNALSEERRRYCFLVDRQCAVAKNSSTYHNKSTLQCSHSSLPDRAVFLAQQMSGAAGGLPISEPLPGAKPLPLPPELAALRAGGALGQQVSLTHLLLTPPADVSGWRGRWPRGRWPPRPRGHGGDVYSNTLPVRKAAPLRPVPWPRSSSMAAGLERIRSDPGPGHLLPTRATVITLLVPEARDGWHYGENEKNRMRGWFPFSYTRLISDADGESMRQLLHHGKSSSTGNLLERDDLTLPVADYGVHPRMAAAAAAQSAVALHGRQQRPYSVAGPGFTQLKLGKNRSKLSKNMQKNRLKKNIKNS